MIFHQLEITSRFVIGLQIYTETFGHTLFVSSERVRVSVRGVWHGDIQTLSRSASALDFGVKEYMIELDFPTSGKVIAFYAWWFIRLNDRH